MLWKPQFGDPLIMSNRRCRHLHIELAFPLIMSPTLIRPTKHVFCSCASAIEITIELKLYA